MTQILTITRHGSYWVVRTCSPKFHKRLKTWPEYEILAEITSKGEFLWSEFITEVQAGEDVNKKKTEVSRRLRKCS